MNETEMNRWKKSRAGAWAGRGFHYQHLFTTLLLVRQWVGLAPTGWIVPEGLEDCVIELPDREIWIQIKSRESGTFSKAEVKAILAEVGKKATLVKSKKNIQLAVSLEQTCSGVIEHESGQLFGDATEKVVVCGSPGEEIVALLSERLGTPEIIAEGLASDLYKFVAEISAANASLSFVERKRISTTEIERRILERLEAEDPSAINFAFVSRALEPLDLITPIPELGFYQGVKTKPGHVVAGLVLRRPTETNSIISLLKNRRHVLVTGPSGAGKSALMWLVANSLVAEFRWFQVTTKAGVQDADSIFRFIRARRPTKLSPIALAFDEVGSSNSNLWDILVHELRGLPDVYFLGSVRKEDVGLISNQSDTVFFEVGLDEVLAQNIWEQLTLQKQTAWSHWREPFEQSDGLMLEYVHLLTQGERLAALIGEQVAQRAKEGRHDELAIIRSTAVLCARGGEIEAKALFDLLKLSPERASQALKRLINEHLVRESRPGVLGGLHTLRSQALSEASHDEVVYSSIESLWRGIRAATTATLPHIIQSVLTETEGETEEDTIRNLAEILAESDNADLWGAILTGLGLGTLERYVASFMSTLEQHGVQRAQWSLASMFADDKIDVPDFSEFEQWQNLRNAILEFRALPKKRDLRAVCLEVLPEGGMAPSCSNLRQANHLMSCLAPIAGGEPIQVTFTTDIKVDGEYDIRDVAALLSTAYLIGPDIAQNLASMFGDEQTLLTWFRSQTPWLATPTLELDGSHGRTVRADWFLVSEDYQPDPHETICSICEMLIALSPTSEAAASDVIDPLGQPIRIGEYIPWTKNMPRQNLPAKTRVAWNVAFRQIMLAKAAKDSLTNYTQQMSKLVRRTEKIFRSFSEKWIKGTRTTNFQGLTDEFSDIISQVNALTYASSETPATSMTEPSASAGENDTLGALLTGVLGNLAPRMGKMPGQGAKALATFSGSLAEQAQEYVQSPIWRTSSSPPFPELKALAIRLTNIACILHEMAHDSGSATIYGIVKAAKKGGIGKAIRGAARRCSSFANQRFRKQLRSVEKALNERGWTAKCRTRPVDESDSVYWPPLEVAILIEIADFETESRYIEESISVGQEHLGQLWRFRVVPVVNGQVIPALALLPSSLMPLPDLTFAEEWQPHIDLSFLSSKTTQDFDQAVDACRVISAILTCRDLDKLHPEEEDVLSRVIDVFKRNRDSVFMAVEKTGLDVFEWALAYLDESWDQVVDEFEAVKAGQMVANPLCMNIFRALAGDENEKTIEFAAARILLLQAECLSAEGA